MTRWWRVGDPEPPPGAPFVAMVKTFDIPETIAGCIRNAAPGMVAIALCRRGGRDMIRAAEEAASERGIRVIWWSGPVDLAVPPEARPGNRMMEAMTNGTAGVVTVVANKG